MPMINSGKGNKKVFEQALSQLKRTELQVGFFPSAQYDDGTKVAYVAAVHEFGAGHVPPRPFFRPTIAERKPVWDRFIAASIKKVLAGELSAAKMLDELGLAVAGDVKKTISKIKTPPLSDKTVAAKRRKYAKTGVGAGYLTKPLIETKLMINSVTHEVTSK